ncbi:MAG: hypothetical protein AMJ53_13175 [Gammaproteobacteria bacterium SG8_11]|nr:MAG: hypothetical protein AMJ53_13175 [Gammaproteobacteria bacterium SG8_11]
MSFKHCSSNVIINEDILDKIRIKIQNKWVLKIRNYIDSPDLNSYLLGVHRVIVLVYFRDRASLEAKIIMRGVFSKSLLIHPEAVLCIGEK